jgi:gliding motility-associated-like protein
MDHEYQPRWVTNTATVAGVETDPDLTDNTITITQDITGDDIVIPNTITPDGDGKNDTWKIPGIDRYPGSIVDIYNRWGNQVYHSNNYDNSWDGHDLNEGTYFYILRLRTPEGERKYKGWILLIR